MRHDKENAKQDFANLIEHSWSYARLTDTERASFWESFHDAKVFGTYNQRWEILHSLYHTFLNAIGYKPIGWRETDQDAPLF